MMMKTIIFDFDGVICDSMMCSMLIHASISTSFGCTVPIPNPEEYVELLRDPLRYFPDQKSLDEYYAAHSMLMSNSIDDMQLNEDLIGQLQEISLPKAIVSSNYATTIKKVLGKHAKAANLFAFIVGKEFSGHKSDKLIHCLNKMAIKRNDAIYVTDSPHDVQTCHKIGLPVVAVSWGYFPKRILDESHPAAIAENPGELAELLSDSKFYRSQQMQFVPFAKTFDLAL